MGLALLLVLLAACARDDVNDDGASDDETTYEQGGQDEVAGEDDAREDDAGGEEEQPPVQGREMITVSVMNWDVANSFPGGQECAIYAYIQDRFGIEFVPYNVTWDNAWDLPLLWSAAGTLPDIIGASTWLGTELLGDWIDTNVIRPLPEDLSRFPYLEAAVMHPAVQGFQMNGQNWFAPRSLSTDPTWFILSRSILNRRDWREELGIPLPQTEEDFLNMWRAFVDNDMGGSGMTFGMLSDAHLYITQATFAGHGDTRHAWVWDYDREEMIIPAFERTSLPLMSFYRQAFREGLIDPDFITNPSAVGRQNWTTGRAGTLLYMGSPTHLQQVYDHWVLNQDIPFGDAVEILMPPLMPGVTPLFNDGVNFWSETYFNSSLDDERMDRVLEFFDWMYSDAGVRMMVFGIPGQDYELDADGNVVMLTELNDEGHHLRASDIHPFAFGGMNYLVVWADDVVEFDNPTIPQVLRDMSREFGDRVLNDPTMGVVTIDSRIEAMHVTEANELPLDATEEWIDFMTNTSDLSDEALWEQFYERWIAHGYGRARDAMTAAVIEAGYH